MLFSWYYKGFKLLRRYMVKHPSGVNLEELDFEEVDKEMEAHEATQAAIASEENAPEGDNPDPRVLLLMQLEGMKLQLEALFSFVFVIYFSFSFFWWCRVCFWALDGNSGTIALYIYIYIYIMCLVSLPLMVVFTCCMNLLPLASSI